MTDDSVPLAAPPPPPPPPPPPRNLRRILRVVGWNLLFILAGLLLIGTAGEAYFRLIGRFGNVFTDLGSDPAYWRFEPGVGLLRPPHEELTLSNGMEYWTVQRANSLGFLDREPIDPVHAEESCHISIIGDSFVEAREVPLSDKLQVRLEEIAAREAPHLDVTTSAFGIQRTGQVNQLPFYDRYARRMSPDMVVLVFVPNDLGDNSTERYALAPGYVPERLPYGQAALDEDGNIRWLPPAIDFSDAVFTRAYESRNSWRGLAIYRFARSSYFMRWLGIKTKLISINDWVYQWFLPSEDDWKRYREHSLLRESAAMNVDVDMRQVAQRDEWGFTSWGLEQFKRRADHDGAALMILAVYDVGGQWNQMYELLRHTAESLGIQVVSQHDYIVGQGGRIEDAHWETDDHWTPAGHQWAADAIWEHIEKEWRGQCPQVDPLQDVEVDWTYLDGLPDEDRRDYAFYEFNELSRFWDRFHTHDGEAQVQAFPEFDLEGYRSVYESVTSSNPIMRSDWDVHLYDEGLTYVKEPCTADDVDNSFFLHVFREDKSGTIAGRQSIVLENLDFHFGIRGVSFEGLCMVSADLPDYDVASIRTGQFIRSANSSAKVWSAHYSLVLPEIVEFYRKLQQSGREPDIRSGFDVYVADNRLMYAKSSCNSNDRDLSFFLHVIPADANQLPAGREESGFDNLDFELMQRGGMHDGDCFASVDLPEYDIASIRTGQFVRGEGNVWEARIEFGE